MRSANSTNSTRNTRHHRPPRVKTSHRAAHVLCMDDDEDLTRIVQARLRNHKIEVSRAGSGREGLILARSHRPKAIITDLEMAKGDGEYLFRRLKTRPSTASIPIIVISGIDDPERLARAFQLGACAVMKKPIDFQVLIDVLSPLMNATVSESVAVTPTPKPKRLRGSGPKFRLDGPHVDFHPAGL